MILRNPSSWRDFFFLACSLFLFSVPVFSQGIIGYVRDEGTHLPLENANVNVIMNGSVISTLITTADGKYEFVSTLGGKASIEVTLLGYNAVVSSNIPLDGYTTHRIDHLLPLKVFELEEVRSVQPWQTSHIEITAEDLKNTAANFDDPVRVAVSEPGIVQINDQANHISVRGQNPIFNTWYLEGLEIVNPNHTNNAGTFSDQPVQSGGGVNMFSAQTLGHTDIYTGINPLSIGRSAGAVIDMHLHETVKPEFRIKAGFLGFEAGGGEEIGSNGILDINLRYSFTGLLADLGVDFGGEKIGFYDGVISYTHTTSRHKLKVFSWYGESKNDFSRLSLKEPKERYKDFFDINYDNSILGIGLKYEQVLSDKLSFIGGAAYSTLITTYNRVGYFSPISESLHLNNNTKLISTLAEIDIQHSISFNTNIGINYTYKSIDGNQEVFSPFQEESFIRPYINIEAGTSLSDFFIEAGGEVNYALSEVGGTASLYPGFRASLQWRINDKLNAFLGARHAAGQNIQTFGIIESYSQPMIIDKYEVGLSLSGTRNFFSIKPYLQEINKLPVFITPSGILHLADESDPIVRSVFLVGNNKGTGRYYGIELDWKFRSDKGWKIGANQTFYSSTRNNLEDEFERGKYNGEFATHIMLAKEIYKVRKNKNRIWNFGLRGMLNGGLRVQEINTVASQAIERTVFINAGNYTGRLPDYKRIDVSISRIIANEKAKWRIALDIQNVLNFSNTAYRYYDPFLGSIQSQEQLGIIPVLSVQLSW